MRVALSARRGREGKNGGVAAWLEQSKSRKGGQTGGVSAAMAVEYTGVWADTQHGMDGQGGGQTGGRASTDGLAGEALGLLLRLGGQRQRGVLWEGLIQPLGHLPIVVLLPILLLGVGHALVLQSQLLGAAGEPRIQRSVAFVDLALLPIDVQLLLRAELPQQLHLPLLLLLRAECGVSAGLLDAHVRQSQARSRPLLPLLLQLEVSTRRHGRSADPPCGLQAVDVELDLLEEPDNVELQLQPDVRQVSDVLEHAQSGLHIAITFHPTGRELPQDAAHDGQQRQEVAVPAGPLEHAREAAGEGGGGVVVDQGEELA
mmetsp:Transcript_46535/g.115858  ORF Transcript_46535/g.115858 Transcript_46535/m.115858 type:complete len:316 (+) Transcript_46535:64-1011(+)